MGYYGNLSMLSARASVLRFQLMPKFHATLQL